TRIVARFGLEHSYYVIGFGLLMSALLYRLCPPLAAPPQTEPTRSRIKSPLLAALHAAWKPLALLYAITVIRSGLQITTNNYLPFLLGEQGYNLTGTGNVLTVFLLMGGL